MHRVLLAIAMILPLLATDTLARQAQPASLFLSSLGVNTHNDQSYNASAYVAMLRYTGISAVRDGGRNLVNLIRLHQQTGALLHNRHRGRCTICCCKSQIEGSYWWSGESRYNVTVLLGAKVATVRIYDISRGTDPQPAAAVIEPAITSAD